MTERDGHAHDQARTDRLLALAILLPPALLAWPFPEALLEHDFVPHLTGTGVVALGTLPAALILAIRAAPGRARGLLLLLLALLLATLRAEGGDTLEASRALILGWTGLVLALCGASLGPAGRTLFARGAVAIAILLLGVAHLDRDDLFTGALGNTGTVSESALAGALVGAAFIAYETIAWRVLGAAALVLEIAYVLRVPVHAGAISAAIAFGACALLHKSTPRPARLACGAVAIALVLSVTARVGSEVASTTAPPAPRTPDAAVAAASESDAGGLAVRASLARRSLALLSDHPWLGVGPGQFAAAYPPYREPAEIERTTHGRALASETEVEHPHDDLLLVLVEGGLLGGLLVIGFLALVARDAVRRLGARDAQGAAFAAAAIGLLANALANAVLSHDPTAATLAFGVFGVVVADPRDPRSTMRRRMLALLAGLVLALHAPRAWGLFQHGTALSGIADDRQRAPDEVEHIVERALDAAPDSVLARTLRARLFEARSGDRASAVEAWRGVLALRPERLEALVQLGILAAASDRPHEARAHFEHALALDPGHPATARNLATLAFEEGRTEDGFASLARLGSARAPEESWLVDLASDLYLRGRETAADALFARIDRSLAPASAEKAYEIAQREAKAGRKRLADASSARANRIWAREHAAAGRWSDAVRLYRQELRISRDYIPRGARNVRLEFAAALLIAGDEAAAQAEIEGLAPNAEDRARLPRWASEKLHASGWFAPPDGG